MDSVCISLCTHPFLNTLLNSVRSWMPDASDNALSHGADESFPPLSGAPSAKKAEPLYDALEEQLTCVRATKRELKKYWPEETLGTKSWPMPDMTTGIATAPMILQGSHSHSKKHTHRYSESTGSSPSNFATEQMQC